MNNLYESYMYEQPLMMNTIAIDPFFAELQVQVNGKTENIKFSNSKGSPKGSGIVKYGSTFSSNGQKYGLDVSFNNDGTVHRILKIFKNDPLESFGDNPPRMDYMHSSNIIKSS